MACNPRPALPSLSTILPGYDRRFPSPQSDEEEAFERYNATKRHQESRRLSISSSCTDASTRSLSPEVELERSFPRNPNVRYLRVRRLQDAHFIVIVYPSATSTSTTKPGQPASSRCRTKLYLGDDMRRLLSKPPNLPAGTVVFPYRVIPVTGPNAQHSRRSSTSSMNSQDS